MAGNGVRIRLKFHDAGLLTNDQIDQGLGQCWHLVRFDEVQTIGDVASDISSVFNLGESCPNGLDLEVDGFALPPAQPAHLLKDSDLVRVRRKKKLVIKPSAEVPKAVRNDQHFICNRRGYVGYGGLELRAFDEFEKETGGYKSEDEEGEMETDISLGSGRRMLELPKVAPFLLKEWELSGKIKRAKDTGTEAGKKKRNTSSGLDVSLANLRTKGESSKPNKAGRRAGIKLCALDEFEGELGGYQNEEEDEDEKEETDISLDRTKAVVPFEVRPSGIEKEKRSAKKHKVSQEELELSRMDKKRKLAVNNTEEQEAVPMKKKKRKSSEVKLIRPGEETTEPVPVKRKKKKSSKPAENEAALVALSTAEDEAALVADDAAGNAQPVSSRKRRSKEKGKNDSFSAPNKGDDSWMDLEDTLMDSDIQDDKQRNEGTTAKGETENIGTPVKYPNSTLPEGHRPSRSSRRKKAKRKWLREQQEKAAKTLTEGDPAKLPPVSKGVMEVETVEELQPVVIRAGHIRFKPYDDEDNAGDSPRPSLPVINLGEQFKSKRQGQNWGQEKTADKQKGKRWNMESGNEEGPEENGHKNTRDRSKDVDFDRLPSLQGVPQDGDVVAYRLVELTTSWTPELSPFRVGVVVFVDNKMNGIKLALHPDYPFRPSKDAESDDSPVEEKEPYPLPYDEDGILETELSALVDLRLLEKKSGPSGGESGGQKAENQGNGSSEGVPSSIAPLAETGDPTGSLAPDKKRVGSQTLAVIVGSDQDSQELMSTKVSDEKDKTQEKAEASPDWQSELTKELLRKKLELRQKNVTTGVGEKDGRPEKTVSANYRKSKYLRSAGVGSIISRLRAEQAL
ncbi:hypothetical protein R1flu_003324 [Riccia fluitans]|uniref:Coilin n=1 Tax=Riccia fluitans TaxID=41844 RepID=A0ABD1YCF4_9MARC